ncbi:hypothetical protein LZ32DRAFT_130768 [Colletotrichum eremochloae]|nr:hypothetical protein LZ32DRAFT_130768 [Colletotrichum eremochloae]
MLHVIALSFVWSLCKWPPCPRVKSRRIRSRAAATAIGIPISRLEEGKETLPRKRSFLMFSRWRVSQMPRRKRPRSVTDEFSLFVGFMTLSSLFSTTPFWKHGVTNAILRSQIRHFFNSHPCACHAPYYASITSLSLSMFSQDAMGIGKFPSIYETPAGLTLRVTNKTAGPADRMLPGQLRNRQASLSLWVIISI